MPSSGMMQLDTSRLGLLTYCSSTIFVDNTDDGLALYLCFPEEKCVASDLMQSGYDKCIEVSVNCNLHSHGSPIFTVFLLRD